MTEIDILRDLVSFNTIDDNENEKIMNYIKKYLEEYNFKCELLGNTKKILVAKSKKEPKFCFFGHTDTVDRNNKDIDPFKLIEKDNNLYGLGVCDMKGGIAAILKVVADIDFDKLKYGIMLVFTYSEEKDFSGIKYFLEQKIDYPEYILVGEPTDNIPMNASKGAIEYHFNFYGKQVHSSRITDSSNINCVNFLYELLQLNKYFKKSECDDCEINHSTMNYGIIKGGNAVNMVSDYTFSTCDFRIIKEEEYKYVKKKVERISKKYNMDYKIGMDFLPFSNDSKIVDYYEKITNKKKQIFYALSEASMLKGNRIILGPGPVTAHQVDEHISKDSLNECVDIYKKIIEYICK